MKKPRKTAAFWLATYRANVASGGRMSPSLLRSEVGLGAFADATQRGACG